LPRFYEVGADRITIDGRDMTQRSLRANIGIVPQDVFLFGGTRTSPMAASMQAMPRSSRPLAAPGSARSWSVYPTGSIRSSASVG